MRGILLGFCICAATLIAGCGSIERREEPPVPVVIPEPPKPAPRIEIEPVRMAAPVESGSFEDWLKVQRERALEDKGLDEMRRLAAMTAADSKWRELGKILDRDGVASDALISYLHLCLREARGERRELLQALWKKEQAARKAIGLEIARAEFCRKVLGFRRYLPMAEAKFRPGSMVLLYLEVRNFSLRPWNDYQTLHLRYDWKLSNGRGRPLTLPAWAGASPEEREDKLEFRGVVRDFHQTFGLPLPKNLPGGDYTLTVTVEDVAVGRTAEVRIPLEVIFQ